MKSAKTVGYLFQPSEVSEDEMLALFKVQGQSLNLCSVFLLGFRPWATCDSFTILFLLYLPLFFHCWFLPTKVPVCWCNFHLNNKTISLQLITSPNYQPFLSFLQRQTLPLPTPHLLPPAQNNQQSLPIHIVVFRPALLLPGSLSKMQNPKPSPIHPPLFFFWFLLCFDNGIDIIP